MNSGESSVTATFTALLTTYLLVMFSTVIVLAASAVDGTTAVTAETWEKMTEGKQVFVEFVSSLKKKANRVQ